MNTTIRLTGAFNDALNARENPADDWVEVGAGFLAEAIDHMEWLEKGNAEWRDIAQVKARHLSAAQATARIAIGHLQAVLNTARSHAEQQAADTDARDWLISIGSEPR